MELYIAGGCGEHGRNCFLLQNGEDAILVDCGLLAGASDNLPRLAPEQIAKIKAVFLTHSHADHTGALPWLRRQGCTAPVIATTPTLAQLPFALENTCSLESLCARGETGQLPQLGSFALQWGRSGHCPGSVWFAFAWAGGRILFSGDYCENSCVYPCDALRGQSADLAVLDCAYGYAKTLPQEDVEALCRTIGQLLPQKPLLFLPVPKYGRGLDLLLILHRAFPQAAFYGDEHFLTQLQQAVRDRLWYRPLLADLPSWVHPDGDQTSGIVFLSNPQLKGAAGERARALLACGAYGVMTGTPDAGSLSSQLLQSGQMTFCRYPVHLNAAQCAHLAEQNHFKQIVRYHSPEIDCESSILI